MVKKRVKKSRVTRHRVDGWANCHVAIAECHVATGHCHVATGHCHVAFGHCHVAIGHCHVATGHCHVATGHCHVATGHCHVTTGHCHVTFGDCHVALGDCHVALGHCHVTICFHAAVTGRGGGDKPARVAVIKVNTSEGEVRRVNPAGSRRDVHPRDGAGKTRLERRWHGTARGEGQLDGEGFLLLRGAGGTTSASPTFQA